MMGRALDRPDLCGQQFFRVFQLAVFPRIEHSTIDTNFRFLK